MHLRRFPMEGRVFACPRRTAPQRMTLGTLGTVLGAIALVLVVFAVLLLILGIFEGHQNPPHLKGKPIPHRPGRPVFDCSKIDRDTLAADTEAKLNFDYGIEKSSGWPIISFIPLFPRTTEIPPEKTSDESMQDRLLVSQSVSVWATKETSASETFGSCTHCSADLKLSYAGYSAQCYGDSQAGMVRLFRRYSCPNGPHWGPAEIFCAKRAGLQIPCPDNSNLAIVVGESND